jgi:hypothetical protein
VRTWLKRLALGTGTLLAGVCLLGSVAGHSAAPVAADPCAGSSFYWTQYGVVMSPFRDAGYTLAGAQRSEDRFAQIQTVPRALDHLNTQARLTLDVYTDPHTDGERVLALANLRSAEAAGVAACPTGA